MIASGCSRSSASAARRLARARRVPLSLAGGVPSCGAGMGSFFGIGGPRREGWMGAFDVARNLGAHVRAARRGCSSAVLGRLWLVRAVTASCEAFAGATLALVL